MKKITLSLLFGLISLIGFSQIGLVENFDASLTIPPGWTSAGYSGTPFNPCSVVSLRSNLSDSNTSDYLESPNILGESNGTDVTVSFDYKIVDWSAAVDASPPGWGEFYVQYSTDNGGSWTTIGTINDVNHVTANTCANMSFVVPAAEVPTGGDFKLRFENLYISGNYYFYMDNVTAFQVVVDPPACSPLVNPTNGATGVAITENLSWQPATGIPSGYTLSVGTTPGGTELVDNVNTGLSTTYDLPDLEYSTTYYVNITPYNDNGPAVDCPEQTFTTGADPNAPVDCGSGIPINTVFCYTNNDTTTFSFQSSDGSPLVVVFNSGSTENGWDELIILDSDGTTNLNDATPYGDAGNLAGLLFISSGDTITVGVTSDGSGISCTSNPWNFDVYCLDTTALPNCNATLSNPVNGAVNVSENTDLSWSAASVFVTGYILNMGTTPGGTDVLNGVDVGDVLTYNPGLLAYSTTYYVSIIPYNDNGQATGCTEESFTTKADPNQVVDCDTGQVINTVHCYDNNEITEWWFASSNGDPISIYFNSGMLEESTFSGNTWDDLLIYDGTDNTGTLLYDSDDGVVGNNDLTGFVFVANSGNLYMILDSDSITSCNSSTTLVEMDFDVSCVDTTALPNCNASLTIPVDGTVDVDEDEDLTWTAASVYVTGYTLNMGTTPGGTDVLNGVDVGNVLTYDPGTLNYDTTYYVTIIPYNDNGPATNCTEESFTIRSDPNQIVDCDTGQVINTVHCYESGTNGVWIEIYSFQSTTGGPLNMFFNSGTIEANWDTLRVTEDDGTIIYEGDNGGDLAGLSINSTGGTMIMYVESDGSVSCESGSREVWDFDVSCIDTTAVPNCNAVLTEPANGELSTDENVDLTWSPASIIVTGYTLYVGTTPGGTDILDGVDVGDVLTYDPGTLPYATTIYVTIVPYNDNGSAVDCTEYSFTTRADPNQVVDCDGGRLNTTYCYTNNDNTEFNFVSSTGFPLVLEFNAGQVENNWDELIILDSDGSELYNGYGNNGDLTGLTFTTSGATLTVIIQSDFTGNCGSNNYTPWDFDVYCQTCMPQSVNFNLINGDCITDPDNPTFEVEVDITDLGDANSLTVNDNQGSAPVVVTEVGVLILGPFVANSNVIVTVENTDDSNCITTSNPMAFLCPPPPNPCSIVFAGDDTSVDCNTPEVTLESNFHLYGQDTTNYEINSIDTCPTPPVDGATPTSVDIDDRWSEVLDLGFEFCFYGGVYDKVIIGSNGVVSFETQHAGTYNEWDLSTFSGGPSTLPNTTNTTITEANIFGPGHDINPATCGSIDYVVLGSAPYRQFVVNYNEVCYFGSQCSGLLTTSQIILHESSNNIDIHILSKPTCMGWNDGLAVVGIQSVDDQFATTPAGRNTSVWTVTPDNPESYRFSPSGTPNYTLEWTDDQGTVIGTEDTVTVSPTQTTTYTFAVTYDLCTGGTATVSDDVEVAYVDLSTSDGSFEMTATCDGATAEILGDTGGEFAFSPEPNDGATIDATTGEITNGIGGTTYTVQYTVGEDGCPSIVTQTVTILTAGDASFTLTPTCDGATANLTGDAGGVFSFNPEPEDGAIIDPVTGEITNGVSNATYTVIYTISGSCETSETQTVTVLSGGDSSFSMEANCFGGATATITGDAGGNFTFDATDGAMIDPVTGEITNAVSGTSYVVEYTTVGDCSSTTAETVVIPEVEDASFTLTPTCDGATATIIGDAGGTFSSTDSGIVVNPDTGEVTGGASNTTYTIEYTTSGPCPETSGQSFTTDTCVIPQVITPNGDGINDSFNLTGYNVNSLEIFNRNGIKVFSYKGVYTNQFEGISDKGDKLPTGTYFYVMKYQEGEVKSAWLYINREK
ncbi:gliding motility-associated C-terminal domain-containing protein [Xanthomarina sp. F1114]|uniref:T9SS type B sorting domain-containing protein n=1 Tax=Xanthomarina sp. F1114 TaxID=2996019 RepID=UPI00225DF7EE|nr:gliding motility-associated C-terminal domain-containing protein [Xanthomarina sp. F1114]MCX7546353.1 gliding motility-associated C-terminal domain-containing protein [Xanthomarina sp. F1114]